MVSKIGSEIRFVSFQFFIKFKRIDDIKVGSVKSPVNDLIKIGFLVSENDVLPFLFPVEDLIVTRPVGTFNGQPCRLVLQPSGIPVIPVIF
jgi:hypothetical protein